MKSLETLCFLLPKILELGLNNLTFAYHAEMKPCHMIQTILSKLAYRGSKLMKLKLTKINLNDHDTVDHIIETIKYSKNMISINLSDTQLGEEHLVDIMKALAQRAKALRDLNLSHNQFPTPEPPTPKPEVELPEIQGTPIQ